MEISKHTFQVKVPSKGAPASRDRALKSRFSTPASLTSVGSCMRRYVLPRHNDGRLALNGRVTISVYSHNMDRNSHGIYRSTAAHSIATTLSVTSSLIRNLWEVTCIDTRAGMRGRVRRRAQRGAVTRKATMVPMSMTAITERTAMCSNVTRDSRQIVRSGQVRGRSCGARMAAKATLESVAGIKETRRHVC